MSIPNSADRGRRLDHQQRAYELQVVGGLQGMGRWTVYGLLGVGAMHAFWPLFRKQTWAIKAFLVTSSSIFGLCIGAEDNLLRYEAQQRATENALRREARNALAVRGIIATEGEIRKWLAEQEAERRAIKEARAKVAIEAIDAGDAAESAEAGNVARLATAFHEKRDQAKAQTTDATQEITQLAEAIKKTPGSVEVDTSAPVPAPEAPAAESK